MKSHVTLLANVGRCSQLSVQLELEYIYNEALRPTNAEKLCAAKHLEMII